jgi:DNA-binding GntR family transcriptional regulator
MKTKLSTSDVYEQLRGQILENRIPPGTRVNIEAVSRQLGVSPTPVREALHRLQGDNLVVATSGRGYSTTPLLDLTALRDLFEFRLLIEPWAARSAAVNRLENPGRRLEKELDAFRDQTTSKDDIRQALVTHDTKFHDLILSATRNDVVLNAYSQTHCHLHIFRLYPADIGGAITIEEHDEVWRAIRDCDPGRAEEAMRQHLTRAYMRFAQAFEEADPASHILRPAASPVTHVPTGQSA